MSSAGHLVSRDRADVIKIKLRDLAALLQSNLDASGPLGTWLAAAMVLEHWDVAALLKVADARALLVRRSEMLRRVDLLRFALAIHEVRRVFLHLFDQL